jgi:subtilisin family serine protease
MRYLLLFSFFIITSFHFAQQKYWVFLTDKDGVSFDPYTYFDAKAIERRIKNNVPIYHESDKPLRTDYYETVSALSDTVAGHSRWFNAMACILTEEQLSYVQELPFVKKVTPMMSKAYLTEEYKYGDLKNGEKLLLKEQTKWLGGQTFKENDITGADVRVCIIDAGFPSVDYADEFAHLRSKIKGTWDFHKNKADVYKFNSHGAAVLSCVGGMTEDGVMIGMATDAEFLLARTELIFKEGLSEEEDWLMAVEWADKNGADIINSSLGYTTSLYFKEDMDGQTALISRAANLAASKGILVVNAAGNDGDGYWKYVGAPADADSVLTVGGINPWTGIHTSFSSYGPTADMRMKPNVAAFGHVIAANGKGKISETQGTSFASPLMAGYAACVMQMFPELTVMEIHAKIEESGHLYPYYDYAHGYGIPNAANLFDEKEESTEVLEYRIEDDSMVVSINPAHFLLNDEVVINYHSRFLFDRAPKQLHIPDAFISDDSSPRKALPNYVYYHLEDDVSLAEYALVAPRELDVLKIPMYDYEGMILRVWYKGQLLEVEMEYPEKEVDEEESEEREERLNERKNEGAKEVEDE